MKAEKVRARGKIAHAMALCFKFVSIAELFHAVEIVVPTEEFIEIEIHEIADLLGATRHDRMHEQRGDAQQIERIDKRLAAQLFASLLIGLFDVARPVLVGIADEFVHLRHD